MKNIFRKKNNYWELDTFDKNNLKEKLKKEDVDLSA